MQVLDVRKTIYSAIISSTILATSSAFSFEQDLRLTQKLIVLPLQIKQPAEEAYNENTQKTDDNKLQCLFHNK